MPQQSVLFPHLAEVLDTMGRHIGAQESLEQALLTVISCTREAVPAAEHVAISRSRDHRVETVVATSEVPRLLDRLHHAAGSGPLLDVIAERRHAVRVGDLAATSQWPEFGAAAADRHGVIGLLAVRMRLELS